MLRKLIGAGAIVALMTGGAFAQSMNLLSKERAMTSEEAQRERAIELQYRETADRIPDKQKKSSDPWGSVRQTPPAASSATRQPKQ
jgi:hypothetical protein